MADSMNAWKGERVDLSIGGWVYVQTVTLRANDATSASEILRVIRVSHQQQGT